MYAPARSPVGYAPTRRAEADAELKGLKLPGTVAGGESPGPPGPTLSRRRGRSRGGHGYRHRQSLPLRSGRQTRQGQARAGRREFAERRGHFSFTDFPHRRGPISQRLLSNVKNYNTTTPAARYTMECLQGTGTGKI